MKPILTFYRPDLWLILPIVGVILQLHVFAQPPQPGDTPAPEVDGPDVFETGILTASITSPATVRAGAIITFDVSGTSDGDVELTITPDFPEDAPELPQDAFAWDSSGSLIYVAIPVAGRYTAIWRVDTVEDVAIDAVKFVAVGSGVPIPPRPPGPSPGDTAFVKWVRVETEKVRATNHAEVAATFRSLANAITANELQGSAAIQTASKEALFGTDGTENAAWGPWWNVVFSRMLKTDRLMTQGQWSAAYRDVAKGIE